MDDSERLAIEYDNAAQRTRRNTLAVGLTLLATMILLVSFFLPWTAANGDLTLGGIRQVFLAAFLVGVLLVFGAAGAAIALTGQARRAVAAAGLVITGPLLAIAFLPVPSHQPNNSTPDVGVLLAGLALSVAAVALSVLIRRLDHERPGTTA